MKKAARITGIICLVIAAALISISVLGHIARSSGSENAYSAALAKQKLIDSHLTAFNKTAPSAVKKAAAAVKGAQTAENDAGKNIKSGRSIMAAYFDNKSSDVLVSAIITARPALSGSGDAAVTLAQEALDTTVRGYVLDLVIAEYNSAYKSVSDAENKLDTAVSGIASVYTACGLEYTAPEYTKTKKASIADFDEAEAAFVQLEDALETAKTVSARLSDDADMSLATANEVSSADSLTLSEKFSLVTGSFPIGFSFTGLLFALLGLILLVWFDSFRKAWRGMPLFSTLVALVVMIVIQVYALGFSFDSYADWGSMWLNNFLNVLRSNSSNGMIALGMTFVIITGGIDLSVGSSLAGIATVVMLILDVSANGRITALGLTGWPNYIVAIAAGLLVGAGLGALIGAGITKGRIPPFILTLGAMEITRSVAQYFTRSFKTEVPKAFQVIANQEIIGGQMLLPIIYWLIIAVVMYIISRHTAFGKHIYAVGSNERTSRLSGINVDRVKIKVYMLMGIIVAIAAITQVARLRGVDVASAGSGYEMNAIAAVVVGGTSMAGGRGSILGTVFGVLIIGIMNNLLVLLGIDAFLSNAFTGAIIIFAVLIQRKDK